MNRKSLTAVLLTCGVVSGILFIGFSILLALVVPGFNIIRVPISVLLLGNVGWMQMINFEVSGLLAVLFAIGMWRLLRPGKAGTWGPILVGLYGLGIIVAGLFHPDPEFGFPAGAPLGAPTTMSMSGSVHGFAFFSLVVFLVAASIVFSRRFAARKEKGWMIYCIATAVAVPALLVLGIALTAKGVGGLLLLGVGTLMSIWISLIAKHLLLSRKK